MVLSNFISVCFYIGIPRWVIPYDVSLAVSFCLSRLGGLVIEKIIVFVLLCMYLSCLHGRGQLI